MTAARSQEDATKMWQDGAKVLSYNPVKEQSNSDSEISFWKREIILFTDLMFSNGVIVDDKLLYWTTFGLFELL